jgi:hypothetical protein
MINYPVNTVADRFTFRLRDITLRNQQWPRKDGAKLEGGDPALVIMLETIAANPVIDSAMQTLGPIEWTDDAANQRTTGARKIINLTQKEIDEAKEDQEDQDELELAKAEYQDLRKGKGTADDRLKRLELVVSRLIREYIKNPAAAAILESGRNRPS